MCILLIEAAGNNDDFWTVTQVDNIYAKMIWTKELLGVITRKKKVLWKTVFDKISKTGTFENS